MDGRMLLYHIQKEGHIGGGRQVGPKLSCIIIIVIGMVFMERVSKMTWTQWEKRLGVGHLAARQLVHRGKFGGLGKRNNFGRTLCLSFS